MWRHLGHPGARWPYSPEMEKKKKKPDSGEEDDAESQFAHGWYAHAAGSSFLGPLETRVGLQNKSAQHVNWDKFDGYYD